MDIPQHVHLVVVDPHELCRFSVSEAARRSDAVKVVAEAGDVDGGLSAVESTAPDVVLLSLHEFAFEGLGRLRSVTDAKVVVVSDTGSGREAAHWLEAGADSLVAESSHPDDVIHTITRTAQGKNVVDSLLLSPTNGRDHAIAFGADEPRLSERETEILELLASGLAPRAIATRLSISRRTVETHLLNMYRKLHIHTQVEAIAWFDQMNVTQEAG